MANIDNRNVLIGNSVSNLKFRFIYPFSGENEKSLALDGGLNEPTVGQPTCYISCKTDKEEATCIQHLISYVVICLFFATLLIKHVLPV